MPSIGHDNAYLVVEGERSTLLVDCAGSPLLKLKQAGIDPVRLEYLVLTHAHPDHLYGFPMLVLGLWLLGASTPLRVVAQTDTLDTARKLLALFHPEQWPGFLHPIFVEVDVRRDAVVVDLPDLRVTSCPTQHLIPSMALKFLNKTSGRAVVYSSDTSPSESVARFARSSQVLIHEASGAEPGHSSAGEAGWVAQRAGVERLFIIHYPADTAGVEELVAEARRTFTGQVELACDLDGFEF